MKPHQALNTAAAIAARDDLDVEFEVCEDLETVTLMVTVPRGQATRLGIWIDRINFFEARGVFPTVKVRGRNTLHIEALVSARRESGSTLTMVAEALGMDVTEYSDLEQGTRVLAQAHHLEPVLSVIRGSSNKDGVVALPTRKSQEDVGRDRSKGLSEDDRG